MRTRESLMVEIRSLMKDLAVNGMNMRMAKNSNNIDQLINLLAVRTEIYKSIAHRQGLLIEVLSNEVEFKKAA